MTKTVMLHIVEAEMTNVEKTRSPTPIQETRFSVEGASAEDVEQALRNAGIKLQKMP